MIEHVAKKDPRARIDHRQFGHGEPLAHFLHRADDPHEFAELAAQAKDAADGRRLGEHVDRAFLKHLHTFFEPLDNRLIAIDDEIEDRVRDVIGPFFQSARIAFQPRAQIGVLTRRADPHGHQEIVAQKQRCLAVFDILAALDHRGARDDKQLLAVHLQLGDLLRAERILDRQRVQSVLAAHQVHFLGRGIRQSHPVERFAAQRGALGAVDHDLVIGGFSGSITSGSDHWHRAGVAKRRGAGNPVRNLLSDRLTRPNVAAAWGIRA